MSHNIELPEASELFLDQPFTIWLLTRKLSEAQRASDLSKVTKLGNDRLGAKPQAHALSTALHAPLEAPLT